MKRLSNFLLIFSVIFICIFSFTSQAQAVNNFSTTLNGVYNIQENGATRVELTVSLKNLTSQWYASSYSFQVGFKSLANVTAYDKTGKITPEVTKNEDGTTIAVKLNDKVVGLNEKAIFHVNFETPEIAQKNGQIWEINIPGVANQDDFSDFNVQLKVPKSFGQASYIKPAQSTNNLTFSKEQLGKSGISLAFGEKQYYQYELAYHLKNNNLFPVTTSIALPPETNYQQVLLDSLVPKPQNVTVDRDGNWIAEYQLLPSKNTTVTAKGTITLSLNPKETILSDEERQLYTKEQTYWDASNVQIKKLAEELKTPEAIYDYVIKTLVYDFSRVTESKPRLGGANALKLKDSAVCLEFTDLFISLARAAGIPAREVDGYAFTENERQRPLSLTQDILHAWPQYYDDTKKSWIMVDPTWGNTTGGIDYFHTLDFDHVTLAIKGSSSALPRPAGGYKYSGDENKKDVQISFAKPREILSPILKVQPIFMPKLSSLLPIKGSINIVNTSTSLSPTQTLEVRADKLTPSARTVKVPSLPPLGKVNLPIEFNQVPFLTNLTTPITIHFAGKTLTQKVSISPFGLTSQQIIIGGFCVLSLFILSLITYKTWRVYVSRRQRQNSLRGEGQRP